MKPTSALRLNWIDWAKVIAIYLVVLGHLLNDSGHEKSLHDFIYAFHMPFFFFLSGYLFRVKEDRLTDLLKRIFKSLILPYCYLNLIGNLFLVPTWVLSHRIPTEQFIYFLTADSRGEVGPTWFLVCLAFVWLFAWLLRRVRPSHRLALCLVCGIAAYYFPYHLYWRIDTAIMVLPFFWIGQMLRTRSFPPGKTSYQIGLFLLSLSTTYLLFLLNGSTNTYLREFGKMPLLYYPMAFAGVVMLCSFCRLLERWRCRFVEVISSGTIVVMALHGIVVLYTITAIFRLTGVYIKDYTVGDKLLLSFVVLLLLYYPILWLQRYFPQVMGNRKIHGANQ